MCAEGRGKDRAHMTAQDGGRGGAEVGWAGFPLTVEAAASQESLAQSCLYFRNFPPHSNCRIGHRLGGGVGVQEEDLPPSSAGP